MRRLTLLVCAFATVVPASAAAEQPTGRLLVTVDGADASSLTHAGARIAGPVVPQIGLITVRAPAGVTDAVLAPALRRLAGVKAVEVERRATLRYTPNDPAFSALETATGAPPGTTLEWWAQREGFPAAWDIARGAGATVAVIDTGVDGNHPELAGRVRDSADFDSTPGHGPATTDEAGHGTHVASLACAAADNRVGLSGAGFGCSLLAIKTDLSDSSVAQSIVWATDHGADSINMSFGTDGGRPAATAVADAIDYAFQRGVVLVAAAADDPVQEQGDPANVLQPTGTGGDLTQGKGLTVTAANFADQRASFAGFGTQISIAAYGAFQQQDGPRGLFGAFPGNETELERGNSGLGGQAPCNCRATLDGDSRYAYLQGTSMAAPMVAAAAALVRRLNPDLTAPDVIRLLKETARRPPEAGWNSDLGWGILDAGAAVARAATIDRRPPSSRLRRPRRSASGRIVLRWTGRDPARAGVTASGIARYELWRAANGRPARRIATTRRLTRVVRAKPGSRYAFFTIAIDAAGNREPAPVRPDVRVRAR